MGVAALLSHAFEWLPWSYWRYEGGRCHAEKELLLIRSFLLNSHLESFHLLNIEFHVDRLVLFKQFVMDNPLLVLPHVQHRFTRMKVFVIRCVTCLPVKAIPCTASY